MRHATLSLCLLPILVGACADSGAHCTPILDDTPSAAFRSDPAACQGLARHQRQFDHETAGATVLGAETGALLGAADEGADDAGGAIAGALAGNVSGALNASARCEAIVVDCLRGRGHRVVG